MTSEQIRNHARFIVENEPYLIGVVADGHMALAKWMLERMRADAPTAAAGDLTQPTPLPMPAFVEHLDGSTEAPIPITPERSDGVPEESGDATDPDLRGACAGAAGRARAAIAALEPDHRGRDVALVMVASTAEWTQICTDEPLAGEIRARVLSATIAPVTADDFVRVRVVAQDLAAALEPSDL